MWSEECGVWSHFFILQPFPFGIHHFVGDHFVGTDGIEGTLRLRHQRVELTALVVGKNRLPFVGRVSLRLLHHSEQQIGFVQFVVHRSQFRV